MLYEISRGWFGKWKVYALGHSIGDRTWLASFLYREDADQYCKSNR
jgi:hypothetical protein